MDLLNSMVEDYGGDIGDLGQTVMPIMAMQAGAGQWKGFSCDDFSFEDMPLGRLAVPVGGRIFVPGLGGSSIAAARKPSLSDLLQSAIRTAATQDNPVCDYNEVADRWEVVVDETIRDNAEGIPFSLDIKMTVYVQYMNAEGYQEIPDATTTAFSQDFDVDLHLELASSDETMDLSTEIDVVVGSKMAVTGLNTATATMNGKTDVGTDIDLQLEADLDPESAGWEKMTVVGGFDLGVTSTNVKFPTTGDPGEICPTSGRVDANLGIDMALSAAGEKETIIDDWKMAVVFNSDGTADMSLQSVRTPSVSDQTTVDVCPSSLP